MLSKLVSRFGGVMLNFQVWVQGTCMLYRRGLLPDLSGVGVKGGFSARNERVTQLSPQRKGWVRDKAEGAFREQLPDCLMEPSCAAADVVVNLIFR
jgi:hypothetical protein